MGIFLLGGVIIAGALIVGPQLWVKRVIQRHATPRPDLPGSGGELAQHLIDHYQLNGVGVEVNDQGDHYDIDSRTVRLTSDNYNGASISAVAIAAHEVSHAIQHMSGERLLSLSHRLRQLLVYTDRFGFILFTVAPLCAVLSRSPIVLFLVGGLGFGLLALRVIVQLVALPIEWDASFKKALPILQQGRYLHEDDMPAARSVLKAAALTYVAAALLGLLDFLRIMRAGR